MTLSDLFNSIQQQTTDQYGGKSWWPAYQQAWAGGKEALAQWMNTEAPKYPDWTPDAAAFASKELAMQQEHTRNLFGVNVDQGLADRIGSASAKLGKAGMIVGGAIAGGAALGGAGAGAAGAEGAGAAGAGAAEAGAAGAGAAGVADAGVYGLSGIESAAAPGFTYGGGAGAAGLADAGAVAGASGFPTLAGSAGADTLGGGAAGATMPAAIPPTDPTFGGALSQTAPGAYEDLGGMGGGFRTDLPVASAPGYSTPMSRILDGSANTADWLSIGGTLGATGLGLYGANQQQNAFQNQYNQYLGLGAPSRARYEASFQPGFKLTDIPGFQDAMNTTTDTLLRRASMGGNPAGNPAALAEINKYVAGNLALPTLENYRNQNAATGGYGAFNTAAPATGAAAINAGAGSLNALGYGINQLANPMPTLDQLFRQAQGSQPQRSLG